MSDSAPVIAVVVFPGSNDDRDAVLALEMLGADARPVWHAEPELPVETAGVVLPGGFSYGDYLRCGAIARFAPVMDAVAGFAAAGGPVLGICNGFQILCEAGLLPGILRANRQLEFLCQDVTVRVEHAETPFTRGCEPGDELVIPVKHGEGNWYGDPELYAEVEASRPDRSPLHGRCERSPRTHRRSQQRGRQRARSDAASRARSRSPARADGRSSDPDRADRRCARPGARRSVCRLAHQRLLQPRRTLERPAQALEIACAKRDGAAPGSPVPRIGEADERSAVTRLEQLHE